MRKVAISTIKNESDIVEAFVRHTLALVDDLVVVDNGSMDGTLEILHALKDEGLSLQILEDTAPGKRQAQIMNRLMHEFAIDQLRADWVFPLDADEFLIGVNGTIIPPDLKADRPFYVKWRSYVPSDPDPQTPRHENPVVRINSRLAEETCDWKKIMVPGTLASNPHAELSMGNHEVLINGIQQPADLTHSVYIAHFPVRSAGQYLSRISLSHLQYELLPVRPPHSGWHYRTAFEELKKDPAKLASAVREAAIHYGTAESDRRSGPIKTVVDPIPYLGGQLRYTSAPADQWHVIRNLCIYAEDLARRYAVLSGALTPQGHLSVDQFVGSLAKARQNFASVEDFVRQQETLLVRRLEHIESLEQHIAATEKLSEQRRKDIEVYLEDIRRLNGEISAGAARSEENLRQFRESEQILREARQLEQNQREAGEIARSLREAKETEHNQRLAREYEQTLREARERIAFLDEQIKNLMQSPTWRVGRTMVGPLGRLRGIFSKP